MPAALAIGITCAALISHLLFVSGKATDDPRLAWLSVGTTLALIGLLLTLFALPSLFAGGGPVEQSADAGAARYLVWHVALIAAAAIALAGVEPKLRSLLIFGGLGALLLAWAAVASTPFGDLASNEGYSPTMRALVALDRGRAGRRRRHLVAARGRRGVLGRHVRAGDDGRSPRWTPSPTSSPPSRTAAPGGRRSRCAPGSSPCPAVGLLIGFIAVAEKLREFEDELTANLVAERERAAAAAELRHARRAAPRTDPLAHADADRRRRAWTSRSSRSSTSRRGAWSVPRRWRASGRRRRADPDRALLPRRARGRPRACRSSWP